MALRTLIHVSDLHIGLGRKEAERTGKLFAEIAKMHPRVPVMITGDLTDSAEEEQFITARRFLDDLAKTNPILAVPGNHDYAWKGNILREDGWENWVKYLGSPLGWSAEPRPWMEKDHKPVGISGLGIWEDGDCAYFGVDSGDPEDKEISARGYVSEKLSQALKASLAEYKNRTRIVLLHHHPFTHGFFTELVRAKRLMDALKDNCELLLFGHDHHYGIWWNREEFRLAVASHKSTDCVSGECLMMTLIEIDEAGTGNCRFDHRLKVIEDGT